MPNVSSSGVCQLCDRRAPKAAMARHLASCAASHDPPRGARGELFHIRVEARYEPSFWLDLEIKSDSTLRMLDEFLRRVWLECCGHLSAFEIGRARYTVVMNGEYGFDRNERSMNARVSTVLNPGLRFRHEYDLGSTTSLNLRVVGTRSGVIDRSAVRLLARNEPPVCRCAVCGEPATLICPMCVDEAEPFSCAKHADAPRCGEPEMFLPVVNSPRMGVCGYTGGD